MARAVAGFSGGDSLSSNKPGPGTKVKEVAASPIGTPSLIRSGAKEADKARPEHAGAISSADVAAAAKDLERQAEAEEARIEGKKTLAASVGAALKEKSSKFKDTATFLTATMKEWDPNRDGSISKMEFRQNVRNLVAKADVKESDSLFESLDTEKKGELDTDAVKKALRKLFDAADKFGGNADAIRASAERLRQRAAIVAEAAELTAAWERATAEHEQVKRESIGGQLGSIIKKKGIKVADKVLADSLADPDVTTRAEFRKLVWSLGLHKDQPLVDELFDELPRDELPRDDSIDTTSLRKALQGLAEESEAVLKVISDKSQAAFDSQKAAKKAQERWREREKQVEREKQEEEDLKKREAEERAASAAEAKAAKLREAEEKAAQKEAEKAAFEAKIATRRGSVAPEKNPP